MVEPLSNRNRFIMQVGAVAARLRASGATLQQVADWLSQCGITMPNGAAFNPKMVSRLVRRYFVICPPSRRAIAALPAPHAAANAHARAGADAYALTVGPIANAHFEAGLTYREIADAMNAAGAQSRRGKPVRAAQLHVVLARYRKLITPHV